MSDFREVELSGGKIAIVDEEDFHRINAFRWQSMPNKRASGKVDFYATCTIGGRLVMMHRFLAGEHTDVVDHWDGNGLNNRKRNLRPTSVGRNNANSIQHNKTGFKGVSYEPTARGRRGNIFQRSKPWRAQITHHKKTWKLGWFDTAESAAVAYDAAARAEFGDFACVNFPRPGERSAITGEIYENVPAEAG